MTKGKNNRTKTASQPSEPREAPQAEEPQAPNLFFLNLQHEQPQPPEPEVDVIEVPVAAQIRSNYDQPEPWNAIADWANSNSIAESKGITFAERDADLLIRNSRGESTFVVKVTRV